jgi:uncharacterized membrane protein YdjX (TVP38/TMEM64 family)
MKVNIKHYSYLISTGGVLLITLIAYNAFVRTEHFHDLLAWSASNILLLCFFLILIKIIGILWPPIPGIVFTVAAIPVIGWAPAFGVDLIGALIGTCFAFGLSRRYGPKVILKLFGEGGLKQVQRFKFKPEKELEAVIVTRAFTSAVSELVSYGAGLTTIRFRNFFLGTLISYLVIGMPMFYLLGFVFKQESLFAGIIPLLAGMSIIYSLRRRYFTWED